MMQSRRAFFAKAAALAAFLVSPLPRFAHAARKSKLILVFAAESKGNYKPCPT